MRLTSTSMDCKQRSSTVSKETPTASKILTPLFDRRSRVPQNDDMNLPSAPTSNHHRLWNPTPPTANKIAKFVLIRRCPKLLSLGKHAKIMAMTFFQNFSDVPWRKRALGPGTKSGIFEGGTLTPGERHSHVTRDDGTVTLCACAPPLYCLPQLLRRFWLSLNKEGDVALS